ncbi:MAG: flavin oxidoreductase [Ignavibacteriaceae bacterium]|nr:flavin reductase [Ignavibacteria bacterium]NNJ51741.1 flavin oxidoreductase [Ignavibacteriaceae bacterium]
MKITKEDVLKFEKLYRAAFINSITGFKSASLIGTVSNNGNTNLAIFNSVIHVGANPPALGFLMRPVSVERHTYENIIETGFFTINHINKDIYRQAHQTSARYEKNISEFDECMLTPEFSDGITAPYVKEANIKIGLKFIEEQEIKYNGTIFIVGEVLEIVLPEDIIGKDGFINIEKAGTVSISGLDSYHETKRISRLSYAKPGIEPEEIK